VSQCPNLHKVLKDFASPLIFHLGWFDTVLRLLPFTGLLDHVMWLPFGTAVALMSIDIDSRGRSMYKNYMALCHQLFDAGAGMVIGCYPFQTPQTVERHEEGLPTALDAFFMARRAGPLCWRTFAQAFLVDSPLWTAYKSAVQCNGGLLGRYLGLNPLYGTDEFVLRYLLRRFFSNVPAITVAVVTLPACELFIRRFESGVHTASETIPLPPHGDIFWKEHDIKVSAEELKRQLKPSAESTARGAGSSRKKKERDEPYREEKTDAAPEPKKTTRDHNLPEPVPAQDAEATLMRDAGEEREISELLMVFKLSDQRP
jgi:hypothetical protein